MPSKKYLCILRSPSDHPCEPPSPNDMEKMFSLFNQWREKFSENIADLGGALSETGKVYTAEKITDGPFIESKEVAGGFMIIAAETYEEVLEVVSQCPAINGEKTSVEIREIQFK